MRPDQRTPGAAVPKTGLKRPVVQKPEKKSFFVDKVVMITGASSGIGRTLAYWYLNNGARVVLVGRDLEELQAIGEEFPAQALVAKCDLTVDIQAFHLKQAVVEKFGRLDVLINCAGKFRTLLTFCRQHLRW